MLSVFFGLALATISPFPRSFGNALYTLRWPKSNQLPSCHKVLIPLARCVHLFQTTTKLLDVRSHGMFPIVQEQGRLACGCIHGVVHREFCHGQHLVPSTLDIPSKSSEVIIEYLVYYLGLTVCLWMIRCAHLLFHSPLFCELTEEY